MKDPPAESRATDFLRSALAGAAVDVPKLDVMAREGGLLGERQDINNAKPRGRCGATSDRIET
jgi:hypothetical protein